MAATAIRRAGLAALMFLASAAGALATHPTAGDHQPPLYPEIIAPTDDSWSADPDLSAFRRQVVAASETLIQTDQGRLYDPAALLPYLDARVEILVGKRWRADTHDFASDGTFSPLDALERLGALSKEGGSADPVVRQRHGMQEIGRLTGEPTVGATPWLAGRICTASYGRIGEAAWTALDATLGFGTGDWVIAVDVDRSGADGSALPGPVWPKRFQLVPRSPSQKRSGGWTGILAPGGGTEHFRTGYADVTSYFAPYLNSHVCFTRREDGWKITAIGYRLD